MRSCLFFFNHPATTEIYTLSLHDALPICLDDDELEEALGALKKEKVKEGAWEISRFKGLGEMSPEQLKREIDRKSTRLNSSHGSISYAVFCLKKKRARRSTAARITPPHQA